MFEDATLADCDRRSNQDVSKSPEERAIIRRNYMLRRLFQYMQVPEVAGRRAITYPPEPSMVELYTEYLNVTSQFGTHEYFEELRTGIGYPWEFLVDSGDGAEWAAALIRAALEVPEFVRVSGTVSRVDDLMMQIRVVLNKVWHGWEPSIRHNLDSALMIGQYFWLDAQYPGRAWSELQARFGTRDVPELDQDGLINAAVENGTMTRPQAEELWNSWEMHLREAGLRRGGKRWT